MFLGRIEQIPPKFSSIKINGQRAYNLVRKDKSFEIKKRVVKIFNLKLIRQLSIEKQSSM